MVFIKVFTFFYIGISLRAKIAQQLKNNKMQNI